MSIPANTRRAEKKASHRMMSFVAIIFAIAVVLGAAYLFVGRPGEPAGTNISAPSGESNQPVR